jgi:hypothetical protein
MRPLTVAIVLALAVFAAVNLGNALHKGGDFLVFVEAGQRLIDGRAIYDASGPGQGVIGPPFQALFFVPFAAIARASLPASRIAWYVLNFAALIAGMSWWSRAVGASPSARQAGTSAPVLLAAIAIVLPAQTNFEHQNMNALLLAVTGAGAWGLQSGRPIRGGVLIGVAAALKAFPGLLIVYLAIRRKWTACFAAGACAAALTIVPGLRYGAAGSVPLVRAWLGVNADGGWPVRLQNQSIYAAIHRAAPADLAALLVVIATVLIVGVMVGVALTRPAGSPVTGRELGLALAVSVLVSPIAWDHYWVLMFPLFVALAAAASVPAKAAFVVAALLVSGVTPLVIGAGGFDLARMWSASTIGGLVLVVGTWGTWRTWAALARGRA